MNSSNNLTQKEQKIQAIYSGLPGIIFQFKIDAKGKRSLPYVSPTLENYIGLSAKIAMKDVDKWFFLAHPSDRTNFEESIHNSMKNICDWNWVGRFVGQDKKTVWMRVNSMPEKMSDDSIIWNGIFTEVSKSELLSLLSEQRLNESEKIAHLGHWDWNIAEGELYWSDEAFRIVGIEPRVSTPSYELFLGYVHPDDRHGWECAVTEAMTKNNYNFNHRFLLDSGEIKYAHGQGNVTYDEKGNPIRMIGTIQDVTERELVNQNLLHHQQHLEELVAERSKNLVAARDEANRANLAKTEFLSHMSHELRTPLNAILGFSQILKIELTSEQNTSVDEIILAGSHLLALINEVLDLSRIESGHLDIKLETVDIKTVLEGCITQLQPIATKRDQHIELNLKDGLSVKADKQLLVEVFNNLISNAIKYGVIGGKIKIYSEFKDENLRLKFQDNGPGIHQDSLTHIFKPFQRFPSEDLSVEGTGIGLTICKKLLEAMSGSIGVASEFGQGSVFWIELPHIETKILSTELNQQNIIPKLEAVPSQGYKILYIEDNLANLRLVSQILAKCTNHTLASAGTAKEGIILVQEYMPDLILLDINLPDMNGYAVLNELSKNSKTQQIPVIAVSANAMIKDLKRADNTGFIDYVTKPIDIDNFVNVINTTLNLTKTH